MSCATGPDGSNPELEGKEATFGGATFVVRVEGFVESEERSGEAQSFTGATACPDSGELGVEREFELAFIGAWGGVSLLMLTLE